MDKPKQLGTLEKLLVGLNSMQPTMIVIIGKIFSEGVSETESSS
jgi:hypothetical protein